MEDNRKLVSIISSGSRGDVEPLIGLALELSKKYRVRILTNAGSPRKFVQSFPGLEYVEIFPGDSDEILRTNETIRTAMAEGDVFKFFQSIDEIEKEAAPTVLKNFLHEMRTNKPDILVVASLADYMYYYARRILKIKVLKLDLQTIGYNPSFAPLGLPTLPFGMHYYILLTAIKGSFFKGFERFNELAIEMGETPLSMTKKEITREVSNRLKGCGSDVTITCQSHLFRNILRPNLDSDKNIYTGACIVDAEYQTKYSDKFGGDNGQKRIQAFLDQNMKKKPVYIGFGSMLGNTPECMIVTAVKALMYADERGIILGGTAGLSFELLCKATEDKNVITYSKKNILFVEAASHEWLFPFVKCTVHHGGSGTTQAALRSGVPTIVTPVFLDQFCHSHVVNELGVGKGFEYGMKKLTYIDLGTAIKDVQSEEVVNRSKEVSIIVRQENGNKNAANVIEKILGEYNKESSAKAVLSNDLLSRKKNTFILPELIIGSLQVIAVACLTKVIMSVFSSTNKIIK